MDDAARLAALAHRAADEVQSGMTLGLGSGSTAEAVIRELGQRVTHGLRIRGVATSRRSSRLASDLGIPLLTLDEVEHLDLGIDGADEIDPALNLVKGRGGALLYEKLAALTYDTFLVVAAAEKLVPQLGTRMPLPVEIIPFGWPHTFARLAALNCHPALRLKPDGGNEPFLSDGGHFVVDCATGPIADPAGLALALKATTGIVDHGLFLGMAHTALVVDRSGDTHRLTPGRDV